MAEYINREEAIKELREVYENEYPTASGDFDEYASHDVPNVLRNMKAADVQPVIHAHWIRGEEKGFRTYNPLWYCSNCGGQIRYDTRMRQYQKNKTSCMGSERILQKMRCKNGRWYRWLSGR